MNSIKAISLLIIFFCFSLKQNAQAVADTKINENTFFTVAPRLGFGVHNYMNFEVGLSAIYIDARDLEFGAASAYSTLIFQQSNWNSSFNTKKNNWHITIAHYHSIVQV